MSAALLETALLDRQIAFNLQSPASFSMSDTSCSRKDQFLNSHMWFVELHNKIGDFVRGHLHFSCQCSGFYKTSLPAVIFIEGLLEINLSAHLDAVFFSGCLSICLVSSCQLHVLRHTTHVCLPSPAKTETVGKVKSSAYDSLYLNVLWLQLTLQHLAQQMVLSFSTSKKCIDVLALGLPFSIIWRIIFLNSDCNGGCFVHCSHCSILFSLNISFSFSSHPSPPTTSTSLVLQWWRPQAQLIKRVTRNPIWVVLLWLRLVRNFCSDWSYDSFKRVQMLLSELVSYMAKCINQLCATNKSFSTQLDCSVWI